MKYTYSITLGCLLALSCFKRAISLNVDIGTPSSVRVTRTFFKATTFPGFLKSLALYTIPYAPVKKVLEIYWDSNPWMKRIVSEKKENAYNENRTVDK